MSVDLILLPFDCDQSAISFSHTVLACATDYPLWEQLEGLPKSPVPQDFSSYVSRDDAYEESHYGCTVTDGYGAPVMAVTVAQLLGFAQHPGVTRHAKNRAIWSYLAALPLETRVALFWH